jgi:hypothetical protein
VTTAAVSTLQQSDSGFMCGLQKLQLAQGLEAEKERRMTLDHYISQVCSTCQLLVKL